VTPRLLERVSGAGTLLRHERVEALSRAMAKLGFESR